MSGNNGSAAPGTPGTAPATTGLTTSNTNLVSTGAHGSTAVSPLDPRMPLGVPGALDLLFPAQETNVSWVLPITLCFTPEAPTGNPSVAREFDWLSSANFTTNTAISSRVVLTGANGWTGSGVNAPTVVVEVVPKSSAVMQYRLDICITPGLSTAPNSNTVRTRPGAITLVGGAKVAMDAAEPMGVPVVNRGEIILPRGATPMLKPQIISAMMPKIYYSWYSHGPGTKAPAHVYLKFTVQCIGVGYGVWA